ncbi:hypothetical protein B0H19DRAFT_1270429 [Mycena capillaripes]|nr:hypothetical protein B0H19DRAFT_1270429 [Mycena capillaripes]
MPGVRCSSAKLQGRSMRKMSALESEEESGQGDQTLVEADRAFGFAFQEKMRAGKMKKKALAASAASAWVNPVPVVATSWRDLTSVAPSLPLSTSNLNHLRDTAKGRLGRMVHVNIVSNLDGEKTIWLPDVTAVFHADTPVADIIQNALDTINETWEARSSSSLVRQIIMPKRILKVFLKKWRHIKGESVCFNILIDVSHFESRTKTPAPGTRGKRAADDDGGKVINYAVKRMRTSVNSAGATQPVPSNTGRKTLLPYSSGLRSQVSSTTKISLHVASVTIGELDGQVTIEWDNSDKCEAVLDDEPCAAGKTKKVYHLMLGGQAYVAKRFIEIGNGRDVVSIDENSAQLTNEMKRLVQGKWFLTQFYERAEETGTQVSADFMFSDGLLVQEIVGDYALTPSPASGVPMPVFLDAISGNPDSAITCQQSLIFADLQSTRGRAPSGSGASILFDVMTHTLSQDSGVGDHGALGIKAILDGHICSAMCIGLEMGDEHKIGSNEEEQELPRRGRRKRVAKKQVCDSDDSE